MGCAALVVATLAPCGAGGAAVVVGGGAGGLLSVPALGAVVVAVVSPVVETVASDSAAVPSPLGSASVAVDVSDDAAHVPDAVVVAVSAPSVVLPDGATASAAGVQEVPVAAVEVSAAASVLSAGAVESDDVAHVPDLVVAVAVSAPSVVVSEGAAASAAGVQEVTVAAVDVAAATPLLSAVFVVSVEDDDVSVDEIEPGVSVAVTSEDVSDAPAVVSEVGALPVASAVVVVLASAETAAVSAEGTAVSTVWSGVAGTSSALAGATKVDVEPIPTIDTAVQRISRSSQRRRQSVRWNAATLRVPSFISSLLAPTAHAKTRVWQLHVRKQGCDTAFRAEFGACRPRLA
jgi:hypothetical protein